MAKSKEKKKHPKAPADVKSVIAIQKEIDARKAALAKRKEAATKDGKLDKKDQKYRIALKRVKRAQRKLLGEAYRILSKKRVEKAKS